MFRCLLSVHSRFGLHARWITQGDPLHQRLRRICYLLRRSDCFRLERPVAGWDSHPLKVAAFARRTVLAHYGVARHPVSLDLEQPLDRTTGNDLPGSTEVAKLSYLRLRPSSFPFPLRGSKEAVSTRGSSGSLAREAVFERSSGSPATPTRASTGGPRGGDRLC